MKYILILLALLYTYLGISQPTQLSLADCLTIALENSHPVKQAKLDITKNDLVLQEKKAAILPEIKGNVNYTRNLGLPTQFQSGNISGVDNQRIPITIGTDNYLFGGIELNQTLFNPAFLAGRAAGTYSQELHATLLQKSEEGIIYDIAKQYYELLKNEAQKEILTLNLERLNKLKTLVELQVENDFGKPTDVKNIALKITEVEVLQKRLNAGIQVQYKAIKLLMGMDLAEQIILLPITPTAELPADLNGPDENLTNLKLLQLQKQLQNVSKAVTKSGVLPTVDLFALLGAQFQDDGFALGSSEQWNSLAYLGLDVNIPIYDGKKRQRKLQQIEVDLQKNENDYQQLRQYSKFEFEKVLAELESQLIVLEAQNEKIALLKDLYNQTNLQYRESSSSIVEVLNAETDLRSAELSYSAQLFDYQLIVLTYLKSKGLLNNLK